MSYAKRTIEIRWYRSSVSPGEVLSRHRTLECSATYWKNHVKEHLLRRSGGTLRTVDSHNGDTLREVRL